VQFTDEGGTLATMSTNLILHYWEVATRTLQRAVLLPLITDSARRLRFALRGNRLAAADDIVTLHDARTGGVIGKFKPYPGDDTDALTFSPDAGLLATSSMLHPVKLWNVATQKELVAVSSHKGSAEGLAFSPDGSLLASASWDDDTVGLLRVATGKAEAPLTGIKEGCSGVAFSPDGRTVAVACEDGTVRLWNLATKREVAVLMHGKAPLRFVVFSPDGQTMVSVCENGTMRFWDAPNPDAPQPHQ
jgi:WD40 repeat protein